MNFQDFYVADKDKTWDWGCGIVDMMSYYGLTNAYLIAERVKIYDNYDFVKGLYRKDDFQYLLNRFGQITPARMVHYDYINVKIDKIVGDWLGQPFDFFASITDKNGIEKKLKKQAKYIAEQLTQQYRQQAQQSSGADLSDPDVFIDPDDQNPLTPKEEMEIFYEIALQYLMDRYNIDQEFRKVLRDLCICKRGFMFVDIVNGDPVAERIDPRSSIYDYDLMKENSNSCGWFARERFLSVPEILDQYRGHLSKEDIKKIKELPTAAFDTLIMSELDLALYYQAASNGQPFRIRVIDGWWVAERDEEWRIAEKEDEFGNVNKHYILVTEDYKKKHHGTYNALKAAGKIVTMNTDDVWEGTKIGFSIHTKIQRRKDQPRSEYGWAKSNIPIKYFIADGIDGVTVSLVDKLRNFNLDLDVVMFHKDLLLSRSLGNIITYDLAFKPDSLDVSEIMAFVKNEGFSFYDSRKEGLRDTSRSGGINSMNASNINDIMALMNFAQYLIQSMDDVSGLNRAWSGNTKASEAVGNTQNSVQQADSIVRPLYEAHAQLCEMTLNGMADLIKYAHWNEGDRLAFVMQGIQKIVTVPPGVSLSDCGIKLKVGVEEKRKKEEVLNVMKIALQSQQIPIETVLPIQNAQTATQAEVIFNNAIQAMKKIQAQSAQQQQQQQQAELQMKAQQGQTPLQIQQMKSETAIEVAQITAKQKLDDKMIDVDLEERLLGRKSLQSLKERYVDHKNAMEMQNANNFHGLVMQKDQQQADAQQQENEPEPTPQEANAV